MSFDNIYLLFIEESLLARFVHWFSYFFCPESLNFVHQRIGPIPWNNFFWCKNKPKQRPNWVEYRNMVKIIVKSSAEKPRHSGKVHRFYAMENCWIHKNKCHLLMRYRLPSCFPSPFAGHPLLFCFYHFRYYLSLNLLCTVGGCGQLINEITTLIRQMDVW